MKNVQGRCRIEYYENIKSYLQKYSEEVHNFFFQKAYNAKSKEIVEPPAEITKTAAKKNLKKAIDEDSDEEEEKNEASNSNSGKFKPLATLDVFAGCGGLSEGLHQAGVCDTKWAVGKTVTTESD